MLVSVIVPTFNRKATLRQTLVALVTQDDPDDEIIISSSSRFIPCAR